MDAIRRLVIVGGVAGGMSAAARARRLNERVEIVVLERGPDVSFAACGLPYYLGGLIPDRDDLLAETAEYLRRRFRLDVRPLNEAIGIDRQRRTVRVRDRSGGGEAEYDLPYDKLILSPGAHPVVPDWPGVEHPAVRTLRNVVDADGMAAILAAKEERTRARALIVGAGYIGLEMAEALAERGIPVSLVSHGRQVLGGADPEMTAPLLEALEELGVRVRLGVTVRSVEASGPDARVTFTTGETETFDLVALAVGVRPETGLARAAGLALGSSGGIKVDPYFRTSDPDILAVGDAIEVKRRPTGEAAVIPLAGPANRQGRQAADNLFGVARPYMGSLGTAVVKVGGAMLAQTGATEKSLAKLEARPCAVTHVRCPDRAGYYPDSTDFWLKVLFDMETGALLGAQAVGPAEARVDKTIDAIAMLIGSDCDVSSLAEAEHAYAPPFATAKSPMNLAGFTARDALDTEVFPVRPREALALAERGGRDAGITLLDVRSEEEFAEGHLDGAVNIPVDELRERMDELDPGTAYWVYCASGSRSHTACRILAQSGFRCRIVSGGYAMAQMTIKAAGSTP